VKELLTEEEIYQNKVTRSGVCPTHDIRLARDREHGGDEERDERSLENPPSRKGIADQPTAL
jgi:hypothetical protein